MNIKTKIIKDNNYPFKTILFYILLFSTILFIGKITKDGIGIISFIIFAWLLLNKKYDTLIYFLIIWIYLNNYFIGQKYITKSKYFASFFNGNLYIIILFFSLFKRKWYNKILNKKLLYWSFSFVIFMFISAFLHGSSHFGFLNSIKNILFFLVVLNVSGKRGFEKKILIILISIGLFEVIVSYLQVSQILPAPIKDMHDINGRYFFWEAGADDVASGTFGAATSNVTSFFETVLFLFFFSLGIMIKSNSAIFLSLLFLIQYATVDSKTALGVTIISTLLLLISYRKTKLVIARNTISLLILVLFGILLSYLIQDYYNYNFSAGTKSVENRIDLSIKIIKDNYQDWGKIAGFKYISEDWIETNHKLNFLIGYGKGNFDYSNNKGKIELMDTPLMSFNNFTRSRSSLINMYGNLGILGLFFLLGLFNILFKTINKYNFKTDIGKSFKYSSKSFLYGSLLFMFLYGGHDYKDLAFLAFLILFALIIRIEEKYTDLIIKN